MDNNPTVADTLVCILLVLTSACDSPEVIENEMPAAYDYSLDLPSDFVRQEVFGIDSKVEEYQSKSVRVSTDFGHYSSPPGCTGSYKSCRIHGERIAGRNALVASYQHGPDELPGEPKPFRNLRTYSG